MRSAWWVVVLCACAPSDRGPRFQPAGNATARRGGELRFGVAGAAPTLDPAYAYDEVSAIAMHALFDTLVDYAPGSVELVPRLAALPEITDGGHTYTFHLRDRLAYSDGTPVVAGDLKYELERTMALADSPFRLFLAGVAGARAVSDGKAATCAGIVAPDPRTLVFHLDEPDASFVYVLTMTFATPQRADHVAAAGDQLRSQPLGSGPYQLDTWDEGARLVLVRNPHDVDAARGYLDRITIHENLAIDTQFMMFERGELDTIEHLDAPDYLWITTQPAWQPYIHQRAMLTAFGSRMTVTQKPFDDRRVRQALNYALDKQHSIRILHGTAVASHGMLPPGLFGRDATIPPYPHDPQKARALLAAAGYPDGFDVTYAIPSDDEAESLALSLQGDLAEVGVRVHLQRMSLATYIDAIGNPGDTPFSKASWLGDYPDPTNFLDTKFHSRAIARTQSNNDSWYANPELDAVLDSAKRELDADRRAALYHRAEQILYDDAPWIWDYHQMTTEVVQPYVRDAEPHPIWPRDYTHAWLDVGPDGKPVAR